MAWYDYIKGQFARFQSEDRGAVTVDWVVLSAAVIGMALGSINIWQDSAKHNAEDVSQLMSDYQISTSFD